MGAILIAAATLLGLGAAPASGSSELQLVSIRDPGFGTDAFAVKVPPGWHVQGAVVYGTGCNWSPFPVFRATGPDGLTALERLPRLDWTWGSFASRQPQKGCLPLKQEVTPGEFLRRLATMMNVDYAGEVPLSAAEAEKQRKWNADADAASDRFSSTHRDVNARHIEVAQAKVRYSNGTFPMEALMKATIVYHRQTFAGVGRQSYWSEACEATVRIVRAREGKLEGAVQQLETAGATDFTPQWAQAYGAMLAARNQQIANQMNQMNAQALQAQNDMFNQSMAIQQQQHDQFMANQAAQQRVHQEEMAVRSQGAAMNTAQAQQNWAASHAVASDWVDYALGQQTVRNPGTGQVNKVPAGYGYTWVNETGKSAIVTHDPNVDPNGHLQGTWTLQQQVHGDGSSR